MQCVKGAASSSCIQLLSFLLVTRVNVGSTLGERESREPRAASREPRTTSTRACLLDLKKNKRMLAVYFVVTRGPTSSSGSSLFFSIWRLGCLWSNRDHPYTISKRAPGVNSIKRYTCNLQVWLLFPTSETMATLVNYTCKSFNELTPD